MTVIYESAKADRPHYCTTADNTLPLGSICRCECGKFWLRKTVIGDYWVGYWVPVRWYHCAARRRITEWKRQRRIRPIVQSIIAGEPQTLTNKTIVSPTVEESMFAKLRDTVPGEGWQEGVDEVEQRIMAKTDDWEALHRWRQADDTTPTRFRVTAKLYGSPFDDEPYSEATWQGTRFQIGEMAGEYAESTDNPLLHMEIDTVEVLDE